MKFIRNLKEKLSSKTIVAYMCYDPKSNVFCRVILLTSGDNGMFGPISYELHRVNYSSEELAGPLKEDEICGRFYLDDKGNYESIHQCIAEYAPDVDCFKGLIYVPFDIRIKFQKVKSVEPRFKDALYL